MKAFLALLAFLQAASMHVERASVPGPDGVNLDAVLVLPANDAKPPSIVALHGCSGPFAARDGSWAVALANAGHVVLLPGSFGSRGLGSQCGTTERSVTAEGLRRLDAMAAGRWLTGRPETPSGGIALLGWSNGGSTVLSTARAAADLPDGLFRRFVALYPGCPWRAEDPNWRPAARVLILMGEDDDWTPAAPCHELASRYPDEITLIAYPGAYHDFDVPDRPVRIRGGAATAPNGQAHVGTSEPARQDALARVPKWLEEAP
jgi:dienelactone hydrolase